MKIFSVHISSLISHITTAMLLLRVKILPRKSNSNLTQLIIGVFYKLGDKERSKESAYVLVAFCFLARPFVSFVSHIARYAPSLTDKRSSLRNQKSTQPNF